MRRVQLKTDGEREVEFEGRTLTLTRMDPVGWMPWVDGDVEQNALYLSRIKCDFGDEDVRSYMQQWCRHSNNAVVTVRSGVNGRALVHLDNFLGERITSTELGKASPPVDCGDESL